MNVTFEELTFLAKIYACNNNRSGSAVDVGIHKKGMQGKLTRDGFLFLQSKLIEDDHGSEKVSVLRPTNKLLQEIKVHDPIEVTAAFIRAGEDIAASQMNIASVVANSIARAFANPGGTALSFNSCYGCAVQWITYKLSLPELVEFISHEEDTIRTAAQNRYEKLVKPKRIPFK